MFVSNWLLSKSTRLPKEINKWDSEQWISHHDLHSIFYLERKGSDRVIKKQAEFSSVSGRSSLPFEDLFRRDCERSWMCAISKCEFYSEQVKLLQIIYRVSHSRAPSLVLVGAWRKPPRRFDRFVNKAFRNTPHLIFSATIFESPSYA